MVANLKKSPEFYKEESIAPILRVHVEANIFKMIYMILISQKCFPFHWHPDEIFRQFIEPYNSNISWKVSQLFDAETIRIKKEKEQLAKRLNPSGLVKDIVAQ
jgi:hypothetical protein